MQSFIFGGNTGMTYQDMLRQRQQAQQLQQGIDNVSGPGGGLNALAKGLAANILNKRANEAQKQGMEQANSAWDQYAGGSALGQLFQQRFGGGTPFVEGASQPAPQQGAAPEGYQIQPQTGGLSSYIKQGLVSRGLPEHVADGFLMNFQDESGLNPGINEQNPTVAGSRGGFGLAQWTGPRRRQLEAFAQQQGKPVSDPDVQMDFLMTELQGSERGAAAKILGAGSAGEAGAAIVNSFLRPAEEHRARREAEYLGGQPAGQGGQMGGQPIGMDADMAQMAALMGNPFLDEGRRSVLQAMFQQRLGRQNAAWEQQMAAQDPYRQLQMQKAELELEAMRNPQPKAQGLINAGNGQIYNPNTGEWIASPDGEPTFRAANPEEAAAYGAAAGQFGPDGRFYPVNPPSGFAVETGPDGQVRVVQGAGAQGAAGKPFTEAQSKDNVFATRAEGALTVLDPIAKALTSRAERAAEAVPFGLARGAQSDDFQVAQNAGGEFLQAILRKDTGAAITAQEQELYGKTYLPQPGDSDAVLAQKGQARRRALEALKSGMSPAQMVAQERALQSSGSEPMPPVEAGQPQRRRYNPQTGSFE